MACISSENNFPKYSHSNTLLNLSSWDRYRSRGSVCPVKSTRTRQCTNGSCWTVYACKLFHTPTSSLNHFGPLRAFVFLKICYQCCGNMDNCVLIVCRMSLPQPAGLFIGMRCHRWRIPSWKDGRGNQNKMQGIPYPNSTWIPGRPRWSDYVRVVSYCLTLLQWA